MKFSKIPLSFVIRMKIPMLIFILNSFFLNKQIDIFFILKTSFSPKKFIYFSLFLKI